MFQRHVIKLYLLQIRVTMCGSLIVPRQSVDGLDAWHNRELLVNIASVFVDHCHFRQQAPLLS